MLGRVDQIKPIATQLRMVTRGLTGVTKGRHAGKLPDTKVDDQRQIFFERQEITAIKSAGRRP
jgi:hypothetical protein